MAKVCPLFSGSSGNSTYISCSEGGVLVDAGVSAKALSEALLWHEIDVGSIRGIFVTHEHGDHVRGIRVFASRHHIPVYATRGTAQALEESGCLQGQVEIHTVDPDRPASAAGMEVRPFPTYHDCRESVGYVVTLPDGRRVAVCTDLGRVSTEVQQAIRGCELVMLESNHDVRMLQNGSYPYYLKQRILGINGHLSNESCAAELPYCIRHGATRILLGHLSKENNLPELARETARSELFDHEMEEGSDYLLWVAKPCGNEMIQF